MAQRGGEGVTEATLPVYLSDYRLFVDRAVTGADYTTIIAYKEPSRWQQEAFGRHVVAPALFGVGLLCGLPALVLSSRRKTEDRVQTPVERTVHIASVASWATCWLVAAWKRWGDSYEKDFPSRLRKDRREVSLSLSQGGHAFARTFKRALRNGKSPVTDILSPAEWGELFTAYISRATRIDNGTPIANLTEAFRAGAISATRNMAYLTLGSQAAGAERQFAAFESDLSKQLEQRVSPYRSKLAERKSAAYDEHAHSTAVVAIDMAQKAFNASRERINGIEQRELEAEDREHAARLRRMPPDAANEVHHARLQVIRKEAESERKNVEYELKIAQELYQPGLQIAEKLLAKQINEAQRSFEEDTSEFYMDFEEKLSALRQTTDAIQHQLSLRLDEERPRCDADDLRTQFSPPTYSIHSSIPSVDPNHGLIREFLQKYANSINNSPSPQPTAVDSIRVSLWED